MVFFERVLHIEAMQEHGRRRERDLRQSELNAQLHDEITSLAALFALSFRGKPIEDGGGPEELFLGENPLALRIRHFCVEGIVVGEGGGGRDAIGWSANGHASVEGGESRRGRSGGGMRDETMVGGVDKRGLVVVVVVVVAVVQWE